MEAIINQPLAFFEESKRICRIKIIEKTYERDMLEFQKTKINAQDKISILDYELELLQSTLSFIQKMEMLKSPCQIKYLADRAQESINYSVKSRIEAKEAKPITFKM